MAMLDNQMVVIDSNSSIQDYPRVTNCCRISSTYLSISLPGSVLVTQAESPGHVKQRPVHALLGWIRWTEPLRCHLAIGNTSWFSCSPLLCIQKQENHPESEGTWSQFSAMNPDPKGRRLFGKRKRFKKVFGPSLRQVQYSPFRACVSVMANIIPIAPLNHWICLGDPLRSLSYKNHQKQTTVRQPLISGRSRKFVIAWPWLLTANLWTFGWPSKVLTCVKVSNFYGWVLIIRINSLAIWGWFPPKHCPSFQWQKTTASVMIKFIQNFCTHMNGKNRENWKSWGIIWNEISIPVFLSRMAGDCLIGFHPARHQASALPLPGLKKRFRILFSYGFYS